MSTSMELVVGPDLLQLPVGVASAAAESHSRMLSMVAWLASSAWRGEALLGRERLDRQIDAGCTPAGSGAMFRWR